MGPQQVLRAAGLVALAITAAHAAPIRQRERVAVIDLGPADPAIRGKLAALIVAGGLDPVVGDGIEDALAGEASDRDTQALAAAIGDAQQQFGALECKGARAAAETAITIAAARQAAGLAVPELGRAWTYVLLCADRAGDTDAASFAATRLRALDAAQGAASSGSMTRGDAAQGAASSGSMTRGAAAQGAASSGSMTRGAATGDVDQSVLARYPDVDALSDAEHLEVDVQAEVPGAALWVDFAPVGASPQHLVLPAGRHVIAAAKGTRRGTVTGTVVKTQPVIAIPMPEQAGAHADVAARIASWHGALPSAAELGWVMAQVHARAVLIRHGGTVEAWGRAGLAEAPRRLGGDDGTGPIADAERLVALIADRARSWSEHAPDPDQPLLTEATSPRTARGTADEPTKWWVYAAVVAAIVAGTAVIYIHDSATDTQRVTLHYP